MKLGGSRYGKRRRLIIFFRSGNRKTDDLSSVALIVKSESRYSYLEVLYLGLFGGVSESPPREKAGKSARQSGVAARQNYTNVKHAISIYFTI